MLPMLRKTNGAKETPFELARRDFDRLWPDFGRFFSGWDFPEAFAGEDFTASYPVDMTEDENTIYVDAEMPGFKKDEIDISAENGMLRLSAERKTEKKKGKKHLEERRYHRVERSFTLPAAVDDTKAKATFKDGVLHLELPKSEESKQHRITVH
jgi:HSP20 family protein